MINVFCGCKLRPQPLGISEQMELLWVYRIHKCAKSTQIFRPQPPNIRPVIHAFYFQFWFFIPEVSCIWITLPLLLIPVKLLTWPEFFIKLCRKIFGSYQSAGILKFRFYQHLQFPMPQKSGNMLYIEQKKKSRRHEPPKLKKYPIRRKDIV